MNYLELAKEILENKYESVGVRGLCNDEKYEVGDDCRPSYEWNFENDCSTYDIDGEDGLKTNGTCATKIETAFFETDDEVAELATRIEEAVKYNGIYGGQQVIIAGEHTPNDSWLDENETRIKYAFVIAKIY